MKLPHILIYIPLVMHSKSKYIENLDWVFLTQIISRWQKKMPMQNFEFTSAIFKKMYFFKYSIKYVVNRLPSFKNLYDHTNRFLKG